MDAPIPKPDVSPAIPAPSRLARARQLIRRHSSELNLALRVAVSAVLTLTVSQSLGLPLPLWGVLTSVILTQMSLGRSLKATADYLLGTIGGALWAGLLGAVVPHDTTLGLIALVAVALAPTAFASAINPRLTAAPVTAALVMLAPSLIHLGYIASALDRVLEVALGGVIGLLVSAFVLPARAHALVTADAARLLGLIARFVPDLVAGFTRGLGQADLQRIQDEIGGALMRLNTMAVEARHERVTWLGGAFDQGPLLRTLLRLRHDVIILGRAAAVPLPPAYQARLGPRVSAVGEALAACLRADAVALLSRGPSPGIAGFETALEGYTSEMAAMRREGATGGLADDAVERLFALGFALEQMHQHLADLDRVVGESARVA